RDPRIELAELLGALVDLAVTRSVVRDLEGERDRLLETAVAAAVDLDAMDLVARAEVDREPRRVFEAAVEAELPVPVAVDGSVGRRLGRLAARRPVFFEREVRGRQDPNEPTGENGDERHDRERDANGALHLDLFGCSRIDEPAEPRAERFEVFDRAL